MYFDAFTLGAPKVKLYLLTDEKKQNPVTCVRTFKETSEISTFALKS
jgi:hypothetical protein